MDHDQQLKQLYKTMSLSKIDTEKRHLKAGILIGGVLGFFIGMIIFL